MFNNKNYPFEDIIKFLYRLIPQVYCNYYYLRELDHIITKTKN
jgi:hypothetical protein